MRTIKLGKRQVTIYDSVDEMPIDNFHLMNKYLIINSGVGQTFQDLINHATRVKKFIEISDKENAYTELDNMILNYNLIGEHYSLIGKAFCYLVHSIDGVECDDLSDTGIEKIYSVVKKSNRSFIGILIDELKKKMEQELSIYFKNRYQATAHEKEFHSELKRRVIILADQILTNSYNEDVLNRIDNRLIKLSAPTKFDGRNGFEVLYNKNYERASLMISKQFNKSTKGMTTLQYYEALDIIEENGR